MPSFGELGSFGDLQHASMNKGCKKGCLVAAGLVACLVIAGGFFIYYLAGEYEKQPKSPGQRECDSAEEFILSFKDREATGNTPTAAKFAEQFARKLRISRQVLFTEGKAGTPSLSKGYFLTYCFERDDSVAILIHVPELRRYTEDAKVSLAEFVWTLAILETRTEFPRATKLAVGIKGVANYSAILTGTVTKTEDPIQGIQTRHPVISTKPLWPFFATEPTIPKEGVHDGADTTAKSGG